MTDPPAGPVPMSTTQTPTASRTRERAVRAIVLVALAVAVAYFAYRGVWRGLRDSGDLTYGYAAAQAWLNGQNPYDGSVLAGIVLAGGGPVVQTAIGHGVYFPTSLPTFLPIAFVTWPVAVGVGVLIDVVGALFIALGLTRWLRWRVTSTPSLAMIAFILALGPIHTTISAGQTAVVATALIVAGMLLEQSRRAALAGVTYALATAAKIQIGVPFIAYLVWRRRWVTSLWAGLVLGVLTIVSVGRMELGGVPWLTSWLANLAWLTGPEGNGDPGPENPDRLSLINLAYPLRQILSDQATSVVTLVGVGAAALVMLWLIRGRHPKQELLALSIVATLCLLVTYHRYYDAVLLALPVAWGFSVLGTPLQRYGLAVLATCAIYILPVLGGLQEAALRLPASIIGSVAWNMFVLPVHAWALVVITVVLLAAAARARSIAADAPAEGRSGLAPAVP